MISYVTYDEAGNLTGAYLQELQPEHQDCSIAVDEAVRLDWLAYRANETRDGVEPLLEQPQLPTQEQYVALAQARLDAFARTRNYDGILSACTYAGSAIRRFAVEGDYAVAARDSTWATCYDLLGQVQLGEIPQPTLDEFEAMLPALEWPA